MKGFTMKTKGIIFLLTIVLLLTACAPAFTKPVTQTIEGTEVIAATISSTEVTYPLIKTAMGDFVIVSARLVDEVRDTKAPPGDKFLLVELARPGLEKLVMGEFSLESFQEMVANDKNGIHVLRDDGSQLFYSGMGGWLNEDEFVMGFTVFQPIPETFTLYWADNAPIELNIEE
jgi:hypothetical protein